VKGVYRNSTLVFGGLSIVLGLAILVRTAAGGGGVGLVIGVLFVGLGVGRIYLLRRR
jgi:hypothetical protein